MAYSSIAEINNTTAYKTPKYTNTDSYIRKGKPCYTKFEHFEKLWHRWIDRGELFSSCADMLSPIIVRLFSIIFDTRVYPQEWTQGIITPVHKKKNPKKVNDYRYITLMSVFGKLFIMNKRLIQWDEPHGGLDDCHFGFRPKRSTTDCIFILTSIIAKLLSTGTKLYCAFIDFQKAFDIIPWTVL
jgi:hypothetical protein